MQQISEGRYSLPGVAGRLSIIAASVLFLVARSFKKMLVLWLILITVFVPLGYMWELVGCIVGLFNYVFISLLYHQAVVAVQKRCKLACHAA